MSLRFSSVFLTIILGFIISLIIMSYMPSSVSYKTNFIRHQMHKTNIARNLPPYNLKAAKFKVIPKPGIFDYDMLNLCSTDLSSLKTSVAINKLMNATFDSRTKWPTNIPSHFKPREILELGKNPGLNIRKIQNTGTNGKGVSIAVITNYATFINHNEFIKQIKLYEEIHVPTKPENDMEGTFIANTSAISIIAGKTVGVAPQAEIYCIAECSHTEYNTDFKWLAKAIDRIVRINKKLPLRKKIRAIAMLEAPDILSGGYLNVSAAIERAKKQNIFVVSPALGETYHYYFGGLERTPMENPELFSSYQPSSWLINYFSQPEVDRKESILLFPMNSRSAASATGANDYVFFRGMSTENISIPYSVVPYLTGLYALACQVKPDITPSFFWKKALKTGKAVEIGEQQNGKIINPIALLASLR